MRKKNRGKTAVDVEEGKIQGEKMDRTLY